MEVTIRGRNVEVTDRLRAAAEEKVGRLSRHHEGWEHAEVQFLEERNPRISAKEVCEATLRGHGRIIRAKAASADSLTSLDKVVDKVEHQIGWAGVAGDRVPPGLGRARPPPEKGPARHAQGAGHGPGQQAGLVEPSGPQPGRRGRRPGHDVDRCTDRRRHPPGQEGNRTPGIPVLQPGHQLPPRPVVGQEGGAAVDTRRRRQRRRPTQLGRTAGARRGPARPAGGARRGQEHGPRLRTGCDTPFFGPESTVAVLLGPKNDSGQVPTVQLLRYSTCSGVRTSISTPMVSSLRRAISLSMSRGTS